MDETEDLVRQFEGLNIEQQQLVRDLIREITSNNNNIETNTDHRNQQERPNRTPNDRFISSDGTALAIGDKVQILTTRKTGRYGDTATIIKFNRKYVAVQLDRNNSITQRDSKYLIYLV